MRLRPRIPLTLSAVSVLAVLTGCSASIGETVSPTAVAEAAADTLEAQIGLRPEIDCGAEEIPFVAGAQIDCVLTDPTTGTSYDTTVTLEDVGDADALGVSVVVANTPRE